MPAYLVHASPYRARLRSPILANSDFRGQLVEILGKSPGIEGVETGARSILLHLNGHADMDGICRNLEKEVPALCSKPSNSEKVKPEIRKYWLRSLLSCGITTVCLAVVGRHAAHALAGGAFALLVTHHVWERRKMI